MSRLARWRARRHQRRHEVRAYSGSRVLGPVPLDHGAATRAPDLSAGDEGADPIRALFGDQGAPDRAHPKPSRHDEPDQPEQIESTDQIEPPEQPSQPGPSRARSDRDDAPDGLFWSTGPASVPEQIPDDDALSRLLFGEDDD